MIPRVIPTLLLQDDCLYKTVRFKKPTYIGDAFNAVRIFNEKEIDELAFLDIRASVDGADPRIEILRDIAGECFMPLAYGGGIRNISQVHQILAAGAEKVVLGSSAASKPDLVTEAAKQFGSQAVVVSIDFRRRWFGRTGIYTKSGSQRVADDPVIYAMRVQDLGAGEILLTSIDKDGTQAGYDLDMIRRVSDAVNVPVIASGGAGSLEHFREATDIGASAVAAGSMFVFHGKHRAVLITYPERPVLEELFASAGAAHANG